MKHSVTIPLTLIGFGVLVKMKVPQTVEAFVAAKVSGSDVVLPEGHADAATFGKWVGGYALLAIIMLGMERTDYANAASAIAWLSAIGVLYVAGPEIMATFHVGPQPGFASDGSQNGPGSPYGGLSAAQRSHANPAATQRQISGV